MSERGWTVVAEDDVQAWDDAEHLEPNVQVRHATRWLLIDGSGEEKTVEDEDIGQAMSEALGGLANAEGIEVEKREGWWYYTGFAGHMPESAAAGPFDSEADAWREALEDDAVETIARNASACPDAVVIETLGWNPWGPCRVSTRWRAVGQDGTGELEVFLTSAETGSGPRTEAQLKVEKTRTIQERLRTMLGAEEHAEVEPVDPESWVVHYRTDEAEELGGCHEEAPQ